MMKPKLEQLIRLSQLITEAPVDPAACCVEKVGNLLIFRFNVTRYHMTETSIHSSQLPIIPVALGVPEYDQYKEVDTFRMAREGKQSFSVPLTPEHDINHVFDILLRRELDTLLTSAQNNAYFIKTGKKHPKTGAGASESSLLTQNQRLFIEDAQGAMHPYNITVKTQEDDNATFITVADPGDVNTVQAYLKSALDLQDEDVLIQDHQVVIHLDTDALLSRMRQRRSNYQGVTVLNPNGDIALAYRHHAGLAGAGGHCSDPYHPKLGAVGIELCEEFGFELKDPKQLEQVECVYRGTGPSILLVDAGSWQLTEEAQKYALSRNLPFCAEDAEFSQGTEQFCSFQSLRENQTPLRNVPSYEFYFPYEAKRISDAIHKQHIKEVKVSIHSDYTLSGRFRIPSKEFGKVTFTGPKDSIALVLSELVNMFPSLKVEKKELGDNQLAITIEDLNPRLILNTPLILKIERHLENQLPEILNQHDLSFDEKKNRFVEKAYRDIFGGEIEPHAAVRAIFEYVFHQHPLIANMTTHYSVKLTSNEYSIYKNEKKGNTFQQEWVATYANPFVSSLETPIKNAWMNMLTKELNQEPKEKTDDEIRLALEKVYKESMPDLKYCADEQDAEKLFTAQKNKIEVLTLPSTKNHELQLLKAELEYRKALYEVRIRNKWEYYGIGFFQLSRSSASAKLVATEKMIQSVESILSGDKEYATDFGSSTQNGQLYQLFIRFESIKDRLSQENQTKPAV